MIQRVDYASHTAYVEPFTGQGLLVMPRPCDDLEMSGPSLHWAAWDAVVRDLAKAGWQPSDPEEDSLEPWLTVGTLADGRDVVGLVALESICGRPDLDEMAEADLLLTRAVGLR